jgi:hypothetical protein
MLEVQKYLLQNNGDFNKLSDEFGIIVNNHPTDKRTILNYCQIDSYKHRFNPIVRECRGLVLNRECFSVIAKGFNRFFNIGENPNDSVFNWNKFETYEKVDGCLQYYTSLKLWGGGSIFIGKMVNEKLYPTLVGMDEKGNIVPTKVKAIKRTGKKNNWIRIKTDSSIKKKNFSNIENSIILTENHNIFLNDTWQPAINAKVNDYLTSYCVEPDENFIHLLNSSLLGDGSLCKNHNSFVFKESHKKSHIEYVNYLKNILGDCFSCGDSRVSGYGSLMERITSKNYSLLKEGLKDTSWTNLKDETVTLEQILELTKDIKVQEIETEKLKSIVLNWDGNPEEIEKIEKSDIQYPVLILMNDDNTIKYILDGNHRIQKSIKYKLPTVKAKLIKFSKLPKWVQNILG